MLLNPLQTRALFSDALDKGYAVLAVNADSPAAVYDCLEAARQADAPIIIETSLWQLEGRSFGAGDAILGLARYLADIAVLAGSDAFVDVPVVFHTDHIKGPRTLDILGKAIRGIPVRIGGATVKLSPSSVSLDASDLSDEENITMISRLAAIAADAGRDVTIEMEAAVDEGITPAEITQLLVGGVESRYPGTIYLWAPGLGTQHGLSDQGYPEFDTSSVKENIVLLKSLTGRPVGLALHGSSGLSESDLRAAAGAGVVKVNWSSESLLVRSTAAKAYYGDRADAFDRKHAAWKNTVMDNGVQAEVAKAYLPVLRHRIEILGGEGRGMTFLKSLNN